MGHLAEVVRKDVEFLKKGIGRGVEWANEVLHIPRVFKTLDDVLWLRNLEEPHAPPLEPRSWPQPFYPGFASLLSLSLSLSNTQYDNICV
jgi:aarF domain-containing kinase